MTVLAVSIAVASIGYGWIERTATAEADIRHVAEADEVQKALRLGKPTVVEFGANACASCREMKPVLDALQREHGERISVLTIDLLKARAYIARYKIQLMPTQVFFDAKGRETGRNMGTVSGSEILARLGVSSMETAP